MIWLITLALLTQQRPPKPPPDPPRPPAAIFADGFETGTPAAWDQAVGYTPQTLETVVLRPGRWPLVDHPDVAFHRCEVARRARAVWAEHGPVQVAFHVGGHRVHLVTVDRYPEQWCRSRGY